MTFVYLMKTNITTADFGEYRGTVIRKYTIMEPGGIQVSIIDYGATITNILVPDRAGVQGDVVLGFNSMEGYIHAGHSYIGSICGRFANRIANGRFMLDGTTFQVSNNIPHGSLHGGFEGFDKKYWKATVSPEQDAIVLRYESKDGEEGYPGNLSVSVTYRVIANALHIEYMAVADKPTPVNLTSHGYFNLSAGNDKDVLQHFLQIYGDKIVAVDENLFPTGSYLPVEGSFADFKNLRKIGEGGQEKGFDYSWVLNKEPGELALAARLVHPGSGRSMQVYTTQPAVHFYSGHLLDEKMTDTKYGLRYQPYAGLCLEAQHFPDSPNQPAFPNTIVYPGELYWHKTIYTFAENNPL